jgi:hypothetical protein
MANSSFEQNSKVWALGEKMFFNIFNHNPDSSVYDFIKKYFPIYTEEPYQGGWTMYPPGPMPVYQSTMHSLLFTKHPYFDTKFREGRLDLLSKEKEGEGPGLTDFHLWFFFDNKNDADEAFAKLSSMFEKLSIHKKIFNRDGRKVAHYSDGEEMGGMNTAEFILTTDELHENKYKLFFRLGAFTYLEENGS